MAKTKIVKVKDFKNWVKAQPDDRKVNMMETMMGSECGCLMVQYGKEVLKKKFSSVGYSLWTLRTDKKGVVTVAEFENDEGIGTLLPGVWYNLKTFGDIKERMKL